jgi:octaprenyl-diphosphate synthase
LTSSRPSNPLDVIADDMQEVDRVITQRLESSVPLVGQVSRYIISAGGKRLRPALLLLACGALDYRGAQRFNLAAVVEFIHTATLLHDDVVDDSVLRRGSNTRA